MLTTIVFYSALLVSILAFGIMLESIIERRFTKTFLIHLFNAVIVSLLWSWLFWLLH